MLDATHALVGSTEFPARLTQQLLLLQQAPSGVAVVGRRKDGGKHGRKGRKGSIGHTGLSARHPESKGKAWIHRKKDAMRAKGYLNVPLDSKYTGRKRKNKF